MILKNTKLAFDNITKQQYSADILVGVDEAGRGCLAGPVVACAVAFPIEVLKNPQNQWLCNITDSKKLTKIKRRLLQKLIIDNCYFSIAEVSNNIIDEINILQASLLAMYTASVQLLNKHTQYFNGKNTLFIIDGNKNLNYYKYYPNDLPQHNGCNLNSVSIIKGDDLSLSIAAASILAKEYRDMLMEQLNLKEGYTNYHFNKNYGYGTKEHLNGIKKHGITNYHRVSFKPLKEDIKT